MEVGDPSGGVRRRRAAMAVTAAVLAALAAGVGRCDDGGADPLAAAGAQRVATVAGEEITLADLERMVRRRARGRALAGDRLARVRAQAMGQLVEETLLRQEVARREIEVTDLEINTRIANMSQELAARKSSLDEFLAASGMDRAGLRRLVSLEIALPKLVSGIMTQEKVREVFEARRRDFDGTRVRVSHVILRPDASAGEQGAAALVERARRIRAEIVSGDLSFAEAARRHSRGPSRERGGDLGFIPRQGMLAEEFVRACFALPEGEVSEPIVTPFGVHLVVVTGIDPGTVPQERFRPQLERLAAESALIDLIEERRAAVEIVLEPGVEVADPRAAEPAD